VAKTKPYIGAYMGVEKLKVRLKWKAIRPSLRKVCLFGIAFVVLNMLDAQLTGTAIALGSTELNPIVAGIGDSMLLKGLIAVSIVIVIVLCKWGKLLIPLSFGMSFVVLWNSFAVWTWS